jgi:hypothetical protein
LAFLDGRRVSRPSFSRATYRDNFPLISMAAKQSRRLHATHRATWLTMEFFKRLSLNRRAMADFRYFVYFVMAKFYETARRDCEDGEIGLNPRSPRRSGRSQKLAAHGRTPRATGGRRVRWPRPPRRSDLPNRGAAVRRIGGPAPAVHANASGLCARAASSCRS